MLIIEGNYFIYYILDYRKTCCPIEFRSFNKRRSKAVKINLVASRYKPQSTYMF